MFDVQSVHCSGQAAGLTPDAWYLKDIRHPKAGIDDTAYRVTRSQQPVASDSYQL
jgi:hypothetical protein